MRGSMKMQELVAPYMTLDGFCTLHYTLYYALYVFFRAQENTSLSKEPLQDTAPCSMA